MARRTWTLKIEPLSPKERGKGNGVSVRREAEIKKECLRLILDGCPQKEIGRMLGSTKSSVSRWCRKAVSENGRKTARTRLCNRNRTMLQKIWDRVNADGECWEWQGHIKENGYGSLSTSERTVYPHRVMYETFIAPIPDGMQVDHICNNRRCCKPDHLQVVNANENLYFRGLDHGKA